MKRKALSLWSLLGIASVFTAAAPAAAVEWIGNGHSYQVVASGPVSWDQARAGAQGLGAGWDLATITSAGEQGFIESLIGAPNPSDPINEYWIGGFQAPGSTEPDQGWGWVTGEPFLYANWAGGEPNNTGGIEANLALDDRFDWSWNDNTQHIDNVIIGYIAEGAPIPEPGTMVLLGSGLLGLAGYGRKRLKA